jgi:hypothetical protein
MWICASPNRQQEMTTVQRRKKKNWWCEKPRTKRRGTVKTSAAAGIKRQRGVGRRGSVKTHKKKPRKRIF